MTDSDLPSNHITPFQLMLSSCTGALLTSIFVTPLDVIKIRMQAQQKEFMRNKCFLYCNGLMDHLCYCTNGNSNGNLKKYTNGHHAYHSGPFAEIADKWYRRPGHFNGTLDAFVKITRNEGITSLWSGLPPTLVMAIPATVIYFTIYDQTREKLTKKIGRQTLWVPILSGGFARIIAVTTISPLEMIRTKMQSKRLTYVEVGRGLRDLVSSQGFLSIWKGLGPTILRDVPFSCIYWANYEFFKQTFHQTEPNFVFSFLAGATAGTVAAVMTLPFDVVKTYRQIEFGERDITRDKVKSHEKEIKSTKKIIKKIYKQNGYKGLFAGLAPRIIKVAPACAIMISTYEFSKSFFKNYNANKITSN